MNVSVAPGKYVVAVSGGVDSVVLLNVLSKLPELELVVAHYDHGIREDSAQDRRFVEDLAYQYDFPFEFMEANLGPDASEATAREKRYEFLESVKRRYHADFIVTAHHKDDVVETACINILRGTGRKGLSSLGSSRIIRPLLNHTKAEILEYAAANGLKWREDSTNVEHKYLRNRIRSKLQTADPRIKQDLESIIYQNQARNVEMDSLLTEIFNFGYSEETKTFSQQFFITLPYNISCELLAFWLRQNRIPFDKINIELLVVELKTGRNGIRADIKRGWYFSLNNKQISLEAS